MTASRRAARRRESGRTAMRPASEMEGAQKQFRDENTIARRGSPDRSYTPSGLNAYSRALHAHVNVMIDRA